MSTEELQNKIDSGLKNVYLVDVLSQESYATRHIPGAKNIPNGPDFLELFEKEIGAPKDAEIIVYCSSSTCMASVHAAEVLDSAGYTNVAHYKDGLAGWQEAGHEFESETS